MNRPATDTAQGLAQLLDDLTASGRLPVAATAKPEPGRLVALIEDGVCSALSDLWFSLDQAASVAACIGAMLPEGAPTRTLADCAKQLERVHGLADAVCSLLTIAEGHRRRAEAASVDALSLLRLGQS